MDIIRKKSRKAVTVEEAQRRIQKYILSSEVEDIALEHAYGRRLAEEVIAPHNLPYFQRSGMDGYAIQSASTIGASPDCPVVLEVREHIPCGTIPTKEIQQHTTARIMTGSMVPDGADAVVMQEMTESFERQGQSCILIKKEIKPGQNVSPIGSELSEGDPVLRKGSKIGPGEMALLATFGMSSVKVYREPKVAIFATGTELLAIDEPLSQGKIRNSNSYMLAAQIRNAGGIPLIMGALPDHALEVKKKILHAFQAADFVITTGGVSVGDYDILVDIFDDWDGDMLFNKVAMRPGSPTTVGIRQGQFLFALSGNPGACFVGFELFVRPVIWGMMGKENIYLPQIKGYLGEDYPKVNGYERYVRGKIDFEDGKVVVKPSGADQSSITTSIKASDCLFIIPPGGSGMSKGEQLSVLLLGTYGDES